MRGLAEGSRWAVHVGQRGGDTVAEPNELRRVAVDGKWTVATRFPAPADPEDDSYFVGFAQERRDGTHGCVVFNSPASPAAGLAQCNARPRIVMSACERHDGSTLVRSVVFGVRRDSRWHLTLTATGAAGGQVLNFDDRAGRRGELVRSRVVITGVEDPRLTRCEQ